MAAQQMSGDAVDVSTSPLLPMANAWLDSMSQKLRAHQTAWEGYHRAGLVSADEVTMLRDAEQAAQRGDMAPVVERGDAYVQLYVRLLDSLSRNDTMQAVFLLADDLVQAAPATLTAFVHAQPYGALQKYADDLFVSVKAAQFLTLVLCAEAGGAAVSQRAKDALDALVPYLARAIGEALDDTPVEELDGHRVAMALTMAGELLRTPPFRTLIWAQTTSGHDDAQLLPKIVALLRVSPKSNAPAAASGNTGVPQLHYLALFCLWVLSFDKAAAAEMDAQLHLVAPLVRVAQYALKLKTVRLVVSLWRNWLEADEAANAPRLLGARVLPLCDVLEERRYSDTELQDALTYVISVLKHRLDEMSSYDEYASQLASGQLSFDNPAHQLEDFWKDNAEKLIEHDSRDLKRLVALLSSNDASAETRAVACHDIGQFVHHQEGSRRRLDALGAKAAIMELVEHSDAQVKYYALQTLAKLVSSSWR